MHLYSLILLGNIKQGRHTLQTSIFYQSIHIWGTYRNRNHRNSCGNLFLPSKTCFQRELLLKQRVLVIFEGLWCFLRSSLSFPAMPCPTLPFVALHFSMKVYKPLHRRLYISCKVSASPVFCFFLFSGTLCVSLVA